MHYCIAIVHACRALFRHFGQSINYHREATRPGGVARESVSMKLTIRHLALTVLLGFASTLQAADEGPHDKAIDARQSMFTLFSFNIGTLSAIAKEKVPYDADAAAEAAANLDKLVSLGKSGFWPAGSDSETSGNAETRALPAIWDDLPDVERKFDDLQSAVTALVPVAGAGLNALQGAIGDVGAACKACHDDYRVEKD